MSAKPTYVVKGFKPPVSDAKFRTGRLGAAWTNDSGSISVKLDPFIDINEMIRQGWTLMLYKQGKKSDAED